MKNYDERIESIFRKYNEKLEAKRRKSALVRRTVFSVSGCCAAAIVGIFVWKIPHRTDITNPGLILPQGSTTSVTEEATTTNTTAPVTTSKSVNTTKNIVSTDATSTTAKKAETTVKSIVTTEKTTNTSVMITEMTVTANTSAIQHETTVKTTETTDIPVTTTETTDIPVTTTEPIHELPDYNTEWHEVEIDRMIKHMSAMYKPFNLEDIIRDTDLVFSGTVISRKEYEVQWTDNNGEILGPYRNGVIEVSVGEVYYGHTDKEIIRIYYPNSFSLKSSGAFLINDNQEYIFMANAFDADFFAEKAANPNDRFEQHKHADVYINGSRSDIMPVKNGIASVFNGYFKDNEEALSRALPKEEVIDSIPDEARSAGWFLFYRKEDLTKLLMELFSRK